MSRRHEYVTVVSHGQHILVRDPLPPPELLRQAIEPHGSRHLPWPRNLFGELASIEELMSEAANPNDVCACGCHGPHHHDIPRTLWNTSDFDIIWLRSAACETPSNRMRRRADGS